ncbi:MAG: hypothetical protein ACI84D_001361 [Thalassolituus oleivorans]|jgi:hypothetical protein
MSKMWSLCLLGFLLAACRSEIPEGELLSTAIALSYPRAVAASADHPLVLNPVIHGSGPVEFCLTLLEERGAKDDPDLRSAILNYCSKTEDTPIEQAGLRWPYVTLTREEFREIIALGREANGFFGTWDDFYRRFPESAGYLTLGKTGLSRSGKTLIFRRDSEVNLMNCYHGLRVFRRSSADVDFGEPSVPIGGGTAC